MKHTIIYIFFLLPFFVCSQKLETKEVIRVSDSILKVAVGENLFSYFKISEGSYYKYKKSNNHENYGKFISEKRLRKNVSEIWVLYHFEHEQLQDARSGLWIKLNQELKLIEPLSINFIPEFLKNNLDSNFISNSKAEEIAIKSFKEKGFEISKPKLTFDDKSAKYLYYSVNKITKTKNQNGQDTGETEIIRIDAITGKIVSLEKGHYGLIIR